MKKGISILLIFAMMMGVNSGVNVDKVSAASEFTDEITPLYLYTQKAEALIDITSNTAALTSTVNGISGTTSKIVITQTLQIRDGNQWRKCTSWTKTYYTYRCSYTNEYTVSSSGTYRNMTEAKVYSGTDYETIYFYSTSVTN